MRLSQPSASATIASFCPDHPPPQGGAKTALTIVPSDRAPLGPVEVAAPSQAKREYRSRSRKSLSANVSAPASYTSRADVERLAEAVTFLNQHYGRMINVAIDIAIHAPDEALEEVAGKAVSQLTHELGLRIRDWAGDDGDPHFHWLYRNRRLNGTLRCRLALHVPYDHMEAAKRWLDSKQWKVEGAEIGVEAVWWNPQPRNSKARQMSRVLFQWNRLRELWSDLDPNVEHWDATRTRKSLRELLNLKGSPQAGKPMKKKSVGTSHSLGRAARLAAEKNKMKLLSAFRDGAWSHLYTGWELLEHKDRMREIAERNDQLRRVEYIGAAPGSLADKRHAEELEALHRQWPDDPRQRARTWTPWWSASEVTT